MERKFNNYQTQLEDLHLDEKPKEVQEQFWDYINNVPYLTRMIDEHRLKAKDLPRDEQGKIIIDITRPHILENMDYFRPTAIHYQKTGRFTDLRPNGNPNSEYGKWAREEIRRCFEGYVRKSDGEWITGDYYFFLNYCPILQAKKDGSKGKKANRVSDFPRVWDGHYYKFHYMNQARTNGHHGAELASRGKGKSYSAASLLAKRFILGESYQVNKQVQSVITAYERKYLSGANQVLDMFKKYIDFCAVNTEWPSRRLVDSTQNLQWKMGYKDLDTGAERGTLNSVIGITSKDDESKLRGSRGVLYLLEEAGCHLKGTEVIMYDGTTNKVENIKVGDKLMGNDGTPREVLHLYKGTDTMYKITLSNGDFQIVNSTHPVYYRKYDWDKKQYIDCLNTAPELINKDITKGYYIHKSSIQEGISYEETPLIIDPYWLGLWLGDGDKTRMAVANEDPEVLDWIENYCKDNNLEYTKRYLSQSKSCYTINISKKNAIYKKFKELNLENNKHIPQQYILNSVDNIAKVIAGLIDTDGTYDRRKHYYEITQLYTRKHILEDIKRMCESIGLKCTLTSRFAAKSAKGANKLNYRLRITGDLDILPIKITRKKFTNRTGFKNKRCWQDYSFKVEPWGEGEFYGFTVDSNNLFLLKDYTVVHNTFPRLLGLYQTLRPSVEDGNDVFGLIYAYGTAGDNDSDFAAMQEIMYNPKGYNMQELNNVYDKEGQGRRYFVFFFPGYLNRQNCYDKDGNSDVTKALLEILEDRYITKYETTDLNAITKRIAEIPITPQEAILRTQGSMFPITQLSERLNQLDNDPNAYDDVYVGNLELDRKTGKVSFIPTSNTPIRQYPLKDNKAEGAIEIMQLPETDSEGKIPYGRYIIGHDPADSDGANTASLTSTFVLDLFTDKIVAEYTGRQMYADDNFETVRRLCIFYNAQCLYEQNKKGLYSYFSKMACTHMLADTPEYLRDKQLIKTIGYGNQSKGVNATLPINNYANNLIREWLIKPTPATIQEDGEDKQIQISNLYFIKNRALLQELIAYNPFINVDRVRALGMLMLFREEKIILYQGNPKSIEGQESKGLAEDPYFTSNYDDRIKPDYTNITNLNLEN